MWGHQRLSICHDELQRMSRILPCQKLISEANKLVSKASKLVPEASKLVPEASKLVPEASKLVSKASKLVSKAVDGSGNPSSTGDKFLTRELAYWQNRSST